ncbi:MAG: hypothetical protein R3272_08730 [Candidatus Promineifilaceae bacterium]|nr:hypothetical protein [Candidatus Promineifilaceae bacterium]
MYAVARKGAANRRPALFKWCPLGCAASTGLGLVAVARPLALLPDSTLAFFGHGRMGGWIGPALEQEASGKLIRPPATSGHDRERVDYR